MKLTLNLKSSYGRTLAYPADATAQGFADLLSTKTLTREHLRRIEALGYAIETTTNATLEDVQ